MNNHETIGTAVPFQSLSKFVDALAILIFVVSVGYLLSCFIGLPVDDRFGLRCFVVSGFGFGGIALFCSGKTSCAFNLSKICAGLTFLWGLIAVVNQVVPDLFLPKGFVSEGMIPSASMLFLFLGAALFFLNFRKTVQIAHWVAMSVMAVGLVFLVGHYYRAVEDYGKIVSDYVIMDFTSAFFFLVLGLGVVLRRPADGLGRMVVSESLGGLVFRRLLPVVLIAPIVLGWLHLAGEHLKIFESSFLMALMVVAIILILLLSLWMIAHQLNTTNTARLNAEETMWESEKSYRNQFANNRIVMLVIDPDDGRILEANSTAVAFYGYSREQLLSMTISNINMLDLQGIQDVMENVRKYQSGRFEFVHRLADGSLRDVDVSSSFIRFGGKMVFHAIIHDITTRKFAERNLKESEEQYRLLVENSVSAVASHEVIFDETGNVVDYKFLSANAAFEKQTGLRVADIIGKRVTEVIPGIEKEPFISVYGEVVKTGKPVTFEHYAKPMGRYFWISAYRLGEGRFATVFNDITERRVAEIALKERESFLKQLLETIPTPVFYKDKEGRYLGVNKAFEELFEMKKEDIIGKDVYDVSPREIAEVYKIKDQELLNKKGVQIYNFFCHNKTRGRRDVTFYKASLTNDKDEITGLIGIILDVTEHKRAEEALKKSEAFSSLLLSTVPTPVFSKDREGRYTKVNKAFETLVWKKEEEIIGKKVFDVQDIDCAKESQAEDDALFADPSQPRAYLSIICDGLGLRHDVMVQKVALFDEEGGVVGLIGSVLDITDLKRTEEELQAVRKQLEKTTERARESKTQSLREKKKGIKEAP